MSALHSCVGFTVQGPDGPLGIIESIAPRERMLSIGSELNCAVAAPVEDVELVDTESALVLLRSSPPPAVHPPAVVVALGECACPTDFACASCGYGVAAGHLPRRCPMCGGHRWRPKRDMLTPAGAGRIWSSRST